MAILGLIWGLLSRVLAWALPVASSVTTALVASSAARFGAVAAALVVFVLWMPMPAWLASLPSLVGSIPASVVFAMGYARVAEGVSIIVGALVVRFLARLVLRALAS